MSGVCVDAGEGGTREGLENKMMKLGRTCSLDFLLAITCAHYGFDPMIKLSYDKLFGDDRIQNRNLLKSSYACRAIQKLH